LPAPFLIASPISGPGLVVCSMLGLVVDAGGVVHEEVSEGIDASIVSRIVKDVSYLESNESVSFVSELVCDDMGVSDEYCILSNKEHFDSKMLFVKDDVIPVSLVTVKDIEKLVSSVGLGDLSSVEKVLLNEKIEPVIAQFAKVDSVDAATRDFDLYTTWPVSFTCEMSVKLVQLNYSLTDLAREFSNRLKVVDFNLDREGFALVGYTYTG